VIPPVLLLTLLTTITSGLAPPTRLELRAACGSSLAAETAGAHGGDGEEAAVGGFDEGGGAEGEGGGCDCAAAPIGGWRRREVHGGVSCSHRVELLR